MRDSEHPSIVGLTNTTHDIHLTPLSQDNVADFQPDLRGKTGQGEGLSDAYLVIKFWNNYSLQLKFSICLTQLKIFFWADLKLIVAIFRHFGILFFIVSLMRRNTKVLMMIWISSSGGKQDPLTTQFVYKFLKVFQETL